MVAINSVLAGLEDGNDNSSRVALAQLTAYGKEGFDVLVSVLQFSSSHSELAGEALLNTSAMHLMGDAELVVSAFLANISNALRMKRSFERELSLLEDYISQIESRFVEGEEPPPNKHILLAHRMAQFYSNYVLREDMLYVQLSSTGELLNREDAFKGITLVSLDRQFTRWCKLDELLTKTFERHAEQIKLDIESDVPGAETLSYSWRLPPEQIFSSVCLDFRPFTPAQEFHTPQNIN